MNMEPCACLYLLRGGSIAMTGHVARHVKRMRGHGRVDDGPALEHDNTGSDMSQPLHVCFAPRRSAIFERVLEEEGVYGDVQVAEWSALDWCVLEQDVLSLECGSAARSLLLVWRGI